MLAEVKSVYHDKGKHIRCNNLSLSEATCVFYCLLWTNWSSDNMEKWNHHSHVNSPETVVCGHFAAKSRHSITKMVKQAYYFHFGCHLGNYDKVGHACMLHIVLCKLYWMDVRKEEEHATCHSCDKVWINQPLRLLFLYYKNFKSFQRQQT
jgi:hypothetical protein